MLVDKLILSWFQLTSQAPVKCVLGVEAIAKNKLINFVTIIFNWNQVFCDISILAITYNSTELSYNVAMEISPYACLFHLTSAQFILRFVELGWAFVTGHLIQPAGQCETADTLQKT